MNTHKLALFALIAAACSNAAAVEQVGFRNKHEAVAACKALVEQDGTTIVNKEEFQRDTELCRSVVLRAFEITRQLGSEYVVGGLSVFGGAEGNLPKLGFVNAGVNLNYGVTAWATFDTEKLGLPSLRFTPLLQGLGGVKLLTRKATPLPIEMTKGFVIFAGRAKKSIFDYNGLYTGGSIEFPSPLTAAMTAKTGWQITVLNNNGNGAFAVIGMSTSNAGDPGMSLGVHEMYSYNYTENGAGLSLKSAFAQVMSGLNENAAEKANQ